MALSTSFLLVLIGVSFILTQAQDGDDNKPAPIECRDDQEYRCGDSQSPTCSDYNCPPSRQPCVNGCFCKKGFLPDDSGSTCYEEKKCRSCRGNTTYTGCGTACPDTCSEGKPEICTKQCFIGCECKKGYVLRNKKDRNSCILPNDCPPSTKPSQ